MSSPALSRTFSRDPRRGSRLKDAERAGEDGATNPRLGPGFGSPEKLLSRVNANSKWQVYVPNKCCDLAKSQQKLKKLLDF